MREKNSDREMRNVSTARVHRQNLVNFIGWI